MAFSRGMRHGKFTYHNTLFPYYKTGKWTLPFPQGTIVFREDACPSGWTRVAELDGKFIKAGTSYNPNAGGSAGHSHSVSDHTHSISGSTAGEDPTDRYVSYSGSNYEHDYETHYHTINTTTDAGGSGSTETCDNTEIQNRVSLIICMKG